MYTHYTPITRDTGVITRNPAGPQKLGKHPIPGAPGYNTTATVLSVETGRVLGWGDATAIGCVRFEINACAVGIDVLSLLS